MTPPGLQPSLHPAAPARPASVKKWRKDGALAAAPSAPSKPAPVRKLGATNTPVKPKNPAATELDPSPPLVFNSALGMVFLMFGTISELLTYVLHVNTYILYLFGPTAFIGAVAVGGIGRTMKAHAGWYWTLFFLCMVIATPFSTWVGGSFGPVMDYAKFTFPLLFVVAGTTLNWNQVHRVFCTIGFAGVINLIESRLFTSNESGRLSLDSSSTIGNSNDLASHIVIILPFLLYIATDPARKALVRYPIFGAVGYGVWVILGTASRGALIALGVSFLIMLFYATAWQRVTVLVVGLTLAILAPMFLPPETLLRLSSLFGAEHEEAQDSKESRAYLFQQSVIYTLQHPVLGVGPAQFPIYEGKMRTAAGERGEWHATHCAWTQVSSECGIPAMLLFIGGIGSAILAVNRIWRRAKKEGYQEIRRACFCFLVAMVGYLVTINFLANAYRFYLPVMIGLAIAINAAGTRYMDSHAPHPV